MKKPVKKIAKKKIKKVVVKSIYDDLTKEVAEELGKLSSWIHKPEHYDRFQYLGKKKSFMGINHSHNMSKRQREAYRTDIHVVKIFTVEKNKRFGSLDRVLIINGHSRTTFHLFNITPEKKLIPVNIFQDDLFKMHVYMLSHNYVLPKI